MNIVYIFIAQIVSTVLRNNVCVCDASIIANFHSIRDLSIILFHLVLFDASNMILVFDKNTKSLMVFSALNHFETKKYVHSFSLSHLLILMDGGKWKANRFY